MTKSRFGIFIVFFVLCISGMLVAQDTSTTTPDQNIDRTEPYQQQDPMPGQQQSMAAVEELRTKLNLRDDQVQDISDILSRYQREAATMQTSPQTTDESTRTNANSELKNRYNTEIETLLDEDQKVQFRKHSDTWWNSVNSQENEGTEINRDKEGTDTQDGTDVERDRNNDGTDSESDVNENESNTEDDSDLK